MALGGITPKQNLALQLNLDFHEVSPYRSSVAPNTWKALVLRKAEPSVR